jgi:hypothetical protein
MTGYLISTPEKGIEPISSSSLVSKIKSSWPDANISAETAEEIALSWSVKVENFRVDGCLFKSGHLSMDGEVEDCIRFAIWYRQQIPQEIELVMYDDSYNDDIQLSSETTEQEMIKVFFS